MDGVQEGGYNIFTWNVASAADQVTPWGRNVAWRDRQLRDFWPTEPYLSGALASVCMQKASMDWEIRGPSPKIVQAVTEMLLYRSIAGNAGVGWAQYELVGTQDLFSQDNGRFEELIRDPGMDANSKFKDENAPVIGLNHLDSNQCIRTGNPETPVIYIDRQSQRHKLKWYQVISYSDFPSPIERMNGVGVCAVSRSLRLAQILRSILIFKDEKIGGRHYKQLHLVSGVSRADLKDEMERGQEEADNQGQIRFIMPAILASLDPEKPVSSTTIDLASLPDNFDLDAELRWYIAGLALDFGVDYQEFAPLPGGNIGSSQQSMILHRKSSGKGPATYMRRKIESYKTYGVLPRGYTMVYNDKDEQEELERQEVRTKALEEAAIAVRSKIVPAKTAMENLIVRSIYTQQEMDKIPEEFWTQEVDPSGNPVGQRGGNTIREDSRRINNGKQQPKAGGRLRKAVDALIGK